MFTLKSLEVSCSSLMTLSPGKVLLMLWYMAYNDEIFQTIAERSISIAFLLPDETSCLRR